MMGAMSMVKPSVNVRTARGHSATPVQIGVIVAMLGMIVMGRCAMIVTLKDGNACGVINGVVKNVPIAMRRVQLVVVIVTTSSFEWTITNPHRFPPAIGCLVALKRHMLSPWGSFLLR